MRDIAPAKSELEPIENASVDELRSLQSERLKRALHYAFENSPFYKKRFEEAQVHPDDLVNLDDLALFPFTVKEDLRRSYPLGMLATDRSRTVRLHSSSGTTGKPTIMAYTRGDIDLWANLIVRCLRAAGVRPGDLVHNSYGYGLFTGGLGVHYGIERLGACVVPIGGGQTAKQITLITDLKPKAIMVTPSYLLNILEVLRENGHDPEALSLEVGILGAEPWTAKMRREIEGAFDMHALDIYGLSEIIGPGVGSECVETKDGSHLWEDHFYPEIIDPETGKVLPDGQEGELVFTTLTKEAMPVVRYRTRDITRLLPGTARPMRRIERVTGRSDDMMILRGVNVYPSQIEEQVLTVEGLAPHFQIERFVEGRMDGMRVCVEPDPAIGQGAVKASPASDPATILKRRIKEMIGINVEIRLGEVGSVPRSQGKAVRVVDLREKK
ncbi:AMP-binding protein [Thioalkalivibrio sp. HK1]|uniref:AMP-binding protein n=1 Tax=Thioalkalivibrio sp. HK1 TaxID=1469245 RepID=UPI00046FE373|nr:AMP-binding protein [Thioalkalivibrio sp. HK1]